MEVIIMAQVLLWILLLAPWLLLIPLDKKRVKRFLSAAFFTIFLTSINWQIAKVYNWWTIKENLFFLTDISAFNYGLLPVATILVFYFTYPNLLLFVGANIAMEAFQAFIISPFIFERVGLYEMNRMSNFGLLLLEFSTVPIIYVYQRWYDSDKTN
jgi:hypothetical protein